MFLLFECTPSYSNFLKAENWSIAKKTLHVGVNPPKIYYFGVLLSLWDYGPLSQKETKLQPCSRHRYKSSNPVQGCARAKPGGPWCPIFALEQLENRRYFIQIIWWAPQILQVQITGLTSIFFRAGHRCSCGQLSRDLKIRRRRRKGERHKNNRFN